MSIGKTITNAKGLTLTYWKIMNIQINDTTKVVTVDLIGYKDEVKKTAGEGDQAYKYQFKNVEEVVDPPISATTDFDDLQGTIDLKAVLYSKITAMSEWAGSTIL